MGDRRRVHANRPAGAKRNGMHDELKMIHDRGSPRHSTRDNERQQSAAGLHLSRGQLLLGVIGQSGVIDMLHPGMLIEELSNLQCVAAVPFHP